LITDFPKHHRNSRAIKDNVGKSISLSDGRLIRHNEIGKSENWQKPTPSVRGFYYFNPNASKQQSTEFRRLFKFVDVIMVIPPLPVFLFALPPLFHVLLLIPLYPGQFPHVFTNTLNTTSNKDNRGFFSDMWWSPDTMDMAYTHFSFPHHPKRNVFVL
jgi:hypothetical protein